MRVRDGDNIAGADGEMLPIVAFSWTLPDRHLGDPILELLVRI